MKLTQSILILAVMTAPVASGAVTLSDASTLWTVIEGNYDALRDQQTGQYADDIIGDANNPGFFTAFDGVDETSKTDGFLAFRVRMNQQDGNKSPYTAHLWVGVDADGSGSIDAYLHYAGGNGAYVGVHGPGNDFNYSPSTTSIVATAYRSHLISTNTGYTDYRAVDYTTDGGTTNDLDPINNGKTDYYVSFQVPFRDLVDFLADDVANGSINGVIDITEDSHLRYILATSTNGNALNQDLGGIDGQPADDTVKWVDQPGSPMSPFITGSGDVVSDTVPEPSSALLALLSATAWFLRRRR